MWDAALDLFFPPHCASCGNPLPEWVNKAVCKACADQVRWIGSDRCLRCGDSVGEGMGPVRACVSCGTHPPRFVRASVATLVYEDGPSSDLVKALKFGGKSHMAATLGRLLAARIMQIGLLQGRSGVVVVPAPLTRAALFHRGYNQAEELARVVASELRLKLETRLLKKIRATQPQALLTEKKRRENLLGAFACDPRRVRKLNGAPILLIDDVITTGSTISECARTLHDAGFPTIYAASCARG